MTASFSSTMMAGASRLPGVMVENTKESITLRVSVTNSYSRGDREFDKAPAMLFPSEIAQHGPMGDHIAAAFRTHVSV